MMESGMINQLAKLLVSQNSWIIIIIISFLSLVLSIYNLSFNREKNIIERYIKFVELLSHDSIRVRIGAIYALERLSKDSRKDYWVIMEVIASFLKTQTKEQKESNDKKPIDTQIALLVISRRNRKHDPNNQQLDLEKIWANRCIFKEINLSNENLKSATLISNDFEEANFTNSNLQNSHLWQCNLQNANLSKAHLQGVEFLQANLQGADFSKANLKGANFSQVKNLTPQQIQQACFWGEAIFDESFCKQLEETKIADENDCSLWQKNS